MMTRKKTISVVLLFCIALGIAWGASRRRHPRLDVSLRLRSGAVPRTGWLVLVDQLGRPTYKRFCEPYSHGEFRLENVPPGRYWIRAHGDFEADEVPVEVVAGAERQHLRIDLE